MSEEGLSDEEWARVFADHPSWRPLIEHSGDREQMFGILVMLENEHDPASIEYLAAVAGGLERAGLIRARQIVWDLARDEVDAMKATYDTTDFPKRQQRQLALMSAERAAGRFDGVELATRALSQAIEAPFGSQSVCQSVEPGKAR